MVARLHIKCPPCLNQDYALYSYVDLCLVHVFGLPMPWHSFLCAQDTQINFSNATRPVYTLVNVTECTCFPHRLFLKCEMEVLALEFSTKPTEITQKIPYVWP